MHSVRSWNRSVVTCEVRPVQWRIRGLDVNVECRNVGFVGRHSCAETRRTSRALRARKPKSNEPKSHPDQSVRFWASEDRSCATGARRIPARPMSSKGWPRQALQARARGRRSPRREQGDDSRDTATHRQPSRGIGPSTTQRRQRADAIRPPVSGKRSLIGIDRNR